jgi:hypothetical protein
VSAIAYFLLGGVVASASIGGVAGFVFWKWRGMKRHQGKHGAFVAGMLRGLAFSPGHPVGLVLARGVDGVAVTFAELADALDAQQFFFGDPIPAVLPGAFESSPDAPPDLEPVQ